MKRKLILWTTCLVVLLGGVQILKAEDHSSETTVVASDSSVVEEQQAAAAVAESPAKKDIEEEEPGFVQIIKTKIIDGGVAFMSIVLLCLILGLSVAIEKVIVLNLSSTNITELLEKLKSVFTSKKIHTSIR